LRGLGSGGGILREKKTRRSFEGHTAWGLCLFVQRRKRNRGRSRAIKEKLMVERGEDLVQKLRGKNLCLDLRGEKSD